MLLKINLKIADTEEAQSKKLEHEQYIILEKELELKRIEEEKLQAEKAAKEKKKSKKPP